MVFIAGVIVLLAFPAFAKIFQARSVWEGAAEIPLLMLSAD